MKRLECLILAGVLFVSFPAFAQHDGNRAQLHSQYVGMETRAIKALSPQQIEGYEAGEGMGFAMAAELNGLPGPRHVLDMADQLELSEEQRQRADQIFQVMHTRAVALGEELIQAEARLDSLCAGGNLTGEQLAAAIDRAEQLKSKLRYTHMVAHVEMNQILSSKQKFEYSRLRGYTRHE